MNNLSLESFLDLAWTDNVRHKLRVMSDRDDLRYLVAWDNAGKLSCSAFTSKPATWPDKSVAIWSKRVDDASKSRTMQAVDLVLDDGMTVYSASKQAGVNESAVHRALTRRKDRKICACCGQVIRGSAPISG
jgi:hypothetical protein